MVQERQWQPLDINCEITYFHRHDIAWFPEKNDIFMGIWFRGFQTSVYIILVLYIFTGTNIHGSAKSQIQEN